MANDTSGKVWVLDTASTTAKVWTGPVYIERMEWHPNAADNDLIVQDGRGKPIWAPIRAIAGAPNHETIGIEKWENTNPSMPFIDFLLHTLDGGTLYVTVA